MRKIEFINRKTGSIEKEQVYGEQFLKLLYGNSLLSCLIGAPIAYMIKYVPFFSFLYGCMQSSSWSAKKIQPFIKKFQIDSSEFAESVSSFRSFNDFFIRKLKPASRPIEMNSAKLVIPADGRYLFYQKLDQLDYFLVKGKQFNLTKLLNCPKLAEEYASGSMAIARLCPTDYHRFHFPSDCSPGKSKLINGWLSSVNPIAIKKNVEIFWENKRTLCILETELFGKILFLEIGASFVGAIHQTYSQSKKYLKGDEKGYFSFGASSLILIFPPNSIQFDSDLIDATQKEIEIKCLMGQSMAKAASGSY
jgi:phosphatidylserine decarboxylase